LKRTSIDTDEFGKGLYRLIIDEKIGTEWFLQGSGLKQPLLLSLYIRRVGLVKIRNHIEGNPLGFRQDFQRWISGHTIAVIRSGCTGRGRGLDQSGILWPTSALLSSICGKNEEELPPLPE